jgi:hypothetical protein
LLELSSDCLFFFLVDLIPQLSLRLVILSLHGSEHNLHLFGREAEATRLESQGEAGKFAHFGALVKLTLFQFDEVSVVGNSGRLISRWGHHSGVVSGNAVESWEDDDKCGKRQRRRI